MRFLLLVLVNTALSANLWADVRVPALFGDHMVVQRDMPVHVWGWADPGETVSVAFRGETAVATASPDGRWEAYLEPAEAGGPYELAIDGGNSIRLSDVLVGDVWVGSGQSNMEWPLERANDAERETAAAQYPGIRYFRVVRKAADTRQDDVEGEWRVVTPATAGEFSGLAYFFARHLHTELGVPFGIIQSAWGGTPAQSWTSTRAFAADPALAKFAAEFKAEGERLKPDYDAAFADWERRAAEAEAAGEEAPRRPPRPRTLNPSATPSWLFNAMIAPLAPYPIRGVIWYQGENDANNRQAFLYRRLFRSLIEDWRHEWGQGDFPFLFVQLPNFARVVENSEWPELREAQATALGLAGTGMAVTIDIGDSNDIHPGNKQDAGLRLALAARAIAYGEQGLEYSGPMYRQTTRQGSALRLWFDHAGSGLQGRGGPLVGFELAGPDGEFVKPEASIAGSSVILTSPDVPAPVQARYAWADDPEGNLINGAGLPASPFRTRD